MFAVQFLRFLVLSMKEILSSSIYMQKKCFYKKLKNIFVFSSKKQNHNLSLRLYAFYFSLVDDNEFDETRLE